jgi:hypothetical protein
MPIKKCSHGYFENLRDPSQATRPHSVHSLLIFLDLLERYAEAIGEVRL